MSINAVKLESAEPVALHPTPIQTTRGVPLKKCVNSGSQFAYGINPNQIKSTHVSLLENNVAQRLS